MELLMELRRFRRRNGMHITLTTDGVVAQTDTATVSLPRPAHKIRKPLMRCALLGLWVAVLIVFGCATPQPQPAVTAKSGYHRFTQPACEVCGSTKQVEGCHVIPQSVIKKRVAAGKLTEAEGHYLINDCPSNIVSLCRGCHGHIQHYGNNFKRWNANVVETIKSFKEGAE